MTEACIVGWAHSPFGKLDDPDVESLIGRVAGAAIEDAGRRAGARSTRCSSSLFNNGFSKQDFPASLVLQHRARTALQAGDALRERLRLGLGRRAWRARFPRRRARPLRAGGRRRRR